MCEDGCIIGELYNDENYCLVTFEEIKENWYRTYYVYNNGEYEAKTRSILDYLDKEKDYMKHFNYCPYCGEKIDWKAMRRKAKESE